MCFFWWFWFCLVRLFGPGSTPGRGTPIPKNDRNNKTFRNAWNIASPAVWQSPQTPGGYSSGTGFRLDSKTGLDAWALPTRENARPRSLTRGVASPSVIIPDIRAPNVRHRDTGGDLVTVLARAADIANAVVCNAQKVIQSTAEKVIHPGLSFDRQSRHLGTCSGGGERGGGSPLAAPSRSSKSPRGRGLTPRFELTTAVGAQF